MSGSSEPKVVLIGLDGATFSILDPLMSAGVMPFLRRWSADAVRAVLRSTSHPLTPIAWTTLMTGCLPGNHGVFDFVRADFDGPQPGFALGTSTDVRVETLWSIASRQGCRVTCLNFPCMFPPPAINGFVVPGFVPWRYLSRAVHPRDLYSRLKIVPGFDEKTLAMDWDIERKALQGLAESEFEDWIRFHTAREAQWFSILNALMDEHPCHLTAILFDGVDKLQHLCYHLLDPDVPLAGMSPWAEGVRDLCLAYFRQLDGFIRAIIEAAGDAARVFIASDHGFQQAGDQIFYANTWLEQEGFLRWKDSAWLDHDGRLTPEGHAGIDTLIDWPGTVAFALTASGNAIWIRRARNGSTGVAGDDYHGVRSRIADSLMRLTNPVTGTRVVERVMTREEAFPGSAVDQAPDLTLVLRDHSFLSVLRSDAVLRPRRSPYGTHHPDGVFMAAGPGVRRGERIAPFSIADITPTILHTLGLRLPGNLDGSPAYDAFETSWLAAHPVRHEESAAAAAAWAVENTTSLGTDAEQEVLVRLRALGYLE